jgi:hypothetical protein
VLLATGIVCLFATVAMVAVMIERSAWRSTGTKLYFFRDNRESLVIGAKFIYSASLIYISDTVKSNLSLGLTLGIIIFSIGINDATISYGADNILKIELDIFSGRENPFWNLSLNESEAFMEKVASLSETKENASLGGSLGYRGIIITGGSIKDKSLEEIRIYRGVVNAKAEGHVLNFSDPGRVLELWLIETGEKHIGEDLYASVRHEIATAL